MKPDPILQTVVKLAAVMGDRTDGRSTQPITLHTGGLLISGHLISAQEFFLDHPITNLILEVHDQSGDGKAPVAEHAVDDDLQFIHLAGAHFFAPGQPPIPTGDGVFWRGRMADVSGFCFGALAVAPASHPV
jgi:hypothetical protein